VAVVGTLLRLCE